MGMKYRIYPNKQEQQNLAVQFGHARFVYNSTLAARKEHYAETGKGLSASASIKRIPILKKNEQTSWLTQADSQVLQQKAMDVDTAYKNFFTGRAGYPSFKNKHDDQSIRYPQRVKFFESTLYLPKIGYVKVKFHRPLVGEQKSVTISKAKSGKYFASVLCAYETETPEHQGTPVGVDLGLKDYAILSDGNSVPHPKLLNKLERAIKIAQRKLSRKKKGSANRNKARNRLALKHERLSNARKDFLHKESAKLTDQHCFIGMETLKVKNMMANHCLAKAIGDSGWGEFVRMLEYKSAWKGGSIFRVGTFYPSSKTCNICKHIFKELQLSDRTWQCENCGTVLDRDVNAAKNILEQATAGAAGCKKACGELIRRTGCPISSQGSMKQEAQAL